MTKVILFDLDGVLIDATEWHYEALNRALALFGYTISRFEHLSSYNGLPTRRKLEMLTVEKGLPRALHPLISQAKQIYTREEILTKCRAVFEREYMVARLKREGWRLGVCSNSIRDTAELMLVQSGIRPAFELVLTNEDVTHHKPDPEVYLTALRRLGLSADEAIAVEDAPPGIESATKAGLRVWKVSGVADVHYQGLRQFIDSINGAKRA